MIKDGTYQVLSAAVCVQGGGHLKQYDLLFSDINFQ